MKHAAAAGSTGGAGRTIAVRLGALVGICLLIPLSLSGWVIASAAKGLEACQTAQRSMLAAHVAERLGAVLSREMAALHELAGQPALRAGELDEGAAAALLRGRAVHRHELFDGIFLLEVEPPRVLLRERGPGVGPDAARLLRSLEAAGRPAFTDLVTDAGGEERLYALVPVLDSAGRLRRIVGGEIAARSAHFTRLLRAERVEGGSVDLVDATGRVAASTDGARFGLRVPFSAELARLVADKRPRTGRCTGCGVGPWPDAPEEFALAPLPAVQWGVWTRQPALVASAFVDGLFRATLWGGALLAGVVLLFAWGAAHSVTRPLRTLTRAAERMSEGQLATPIPTLPDDEVGRLGAALETMRRSLADSRERIERMNEGLEVTVRRRTAELERLNALLRERELDRTVLLRKVMSAEEDERKRVARELHDETSQSLAALAMRLEALAPALPESARAGVTALTELAREALDEVRRIMVDLRPSVLDDLGLEAAISWAAERSLRAAGIQVRCEFSGFEERLGREQETTIFRAIQESLTNVAKHSGAERVLIQGCRRDGDVVVEIEDDGRGFDPSAVTHPAHSGRGLGLLGMRERVELLGGRVEVESALGQGTRIVLTVPAGPPRTVEVSHA